jgi:hypothetical protein
MPGAQCPIGWYSEAERNALRGQACRVLPRGDIHVLIIVPHALRRLLTAALRDLMDARPPDHRALALVPNPHA